MNKGKENYQNIPLPDGLSDAVQKGLKKGKRHMEKKWIAAIGTLAAACVLGFVVLRVLPASLRTPQGSDAASQSRMAPSDGQTPEAAAFTATETAAGDSTETDPSAASPEDSTAAVENTASSSIRVYGTVTQIENGQILLENDEEGAAYPQVLLNLTEDTLILSGEDCSQKTLSDIAVGDTLYADISPAMTRSLPPMANAFTVFCEIPEDSAVPTYAQITDISTDDDGTLRITTDQDLILIPGEDTAVLSLDGGETLDASDLAVGDTILAKYQIMTMSIPAQTSPEEIRLVAKASDTAAAESAENTTSSIRVFGAANEISIGGIKNGQILLENDEEGAAYPQVLLNITEDTLILSAEDYSQKTLSDIAVGDTLYADISPAMTRSIPPMSNAVVVFCEVAEDSVIPTCAQITDIQTAEDGQVTIVTDQSLNLLPNESTRVLSLDGSSELSVSDLAIGDTILARFQIMTASIPAQTNPEEIRVVAKAGDSQTTAVQ